MAAAAEADLVTQSIVFLSAAVIAIPIFKKAGMGSVLGYLCAGAIIGPWGLGFGGSPQAVLHFAEIGVVLLLFVIGLELKPGRLWSLRRDIFGLGLAQVLGCGILLTALAWGSGFSTNTAIVAGFGLALSSTAFALQILEEKGALNTAFGRKAFAILLFQDLSIVPLLALVAFLAPAAAATAGTASGWTGLAIMVGAVAALIAAGRFLLNPMFALLSKAQSREILTAGALLVVLASAWSMQLAGLSMALGAFLAGVLLAESSYRHQLEADIEPFRGLLLGLFFIAVGMSLDWGLVFANWIYVLGIVVVFMAVKAIIIWGAARAFGSTNTDAQRVAVTIPQGGEFAFVLFTVATQNAVMNAEEAGILTAAVTLSMALTPALVAGHVALLRTLSPTEAQEIEEEFEGNDSRIIVIGSGRVGQVVNEVLREAGLAFTAIDHDAERIDAARKFCSKVYFGDATRLDVLRAAGAEKAQVIVLCIDNREVLTKAIDQIRAEFPQAALLCRSYDRTHSMELIEADVDFEIRETFESSIVLARSVLERLAMDDEQIADIESDFRRRDWDRLLLQVEGDVYSGMELLNREPPGQSQS